MSKTYIEDPKVNTKKCVFLSSYTHCPYASEKDECFAPSCPKGLQWDRYEWDFLSPPSRKAISYMDNFADRSREITICLKHLSSEERFKLFSNPSNLTDEMKEIIEKYDKALKESNMDTYIKID